MPWVPPGYANVQPLGSDKIANVPPTGLTTWANAQRLPCGCPGGWALLELTDALQGQILTPDWKTLCVTEYVSKKHTLLIEGGLNPKMWIKNWMHYLFVEHLTNLITDLQLFAFHTCSFKISSNIITSWQRHASQTAFMILPTERFPLMR